MDKFDTFMFGIAVGVTLFGTVTILVVPDYDALKSDVKTYFDKPKFCSESYLNLTADQMRMCDIFKEKK